MTLRFGFEKWARGTRDEWVVDDRRGQWEQFLEKPVVGTMLKLVAREKDFQHPKRPIAVIMDNSGCREIIIRQTLSGTECEKMLQNVGKKVLR